VSTKACWLDSVHFVLVREGCRWAADGTLIATGYVPPGTKDPGGETNFGIAKRWHPNVDIAKLSLQGAMTIYWTDYWLKFQCDTMSDPWALFVFDSAVQHPPSAVALFEKENALCAALDDRMAFYRSLPEWADFGSGWTVRMTSLRQKLQTTYGIVCGGTP
jgi:lysozyme family protein